MSGKVKMSRVDVDRLVSMVEAGDRIPAIKDFRALSGWGLKESKDLLVGPNSLKPITQMRSELLALCDEPSRAEMIDEARSLAARLEALVAVLAEAIDGSGPDQVPILGGGRPAVWDGDWRSINVGDAVKCGGVWRRVETVEPTDYSGGMPVYVETIGWLYESDIREVRYK